MSKSKISEHLAAYKATNDFLQLHPAPANIRKFSLFQELMKKKDLRERYDNSPEFRQNVYGWLENDRISDAKQMRSPASFRTVKQQRLWINRVSMLPQRF